MLETFVPGRGARDDRDRRRRRGRRLVVALPAVPLALRRPCPRPRPRRRLRRRLPAQEDRATTTPSASSCSPASRRSWSSGSRPPASSSWTSMAARCTDARQPMVPRPFRVERRKRARPTTRGRSRSSPSRASSSTSRRASSRCSTPSASARCRSRSAARRSSRRSGPSGPSPARSARRAPGTVVGVRGPFGTSWPVEEAKGSDLLIVAGGVGLPPVRPALITRSSTAPTTAA